MSSVALFTCPRLDGMVGVMLQRQKGGTQRISNATPIEIQSRLEARRTLLVVSIRPFTSDQMTNPFQPFSSPVIHALRFSVFITMFITQSFIGVIITHSTHSPHSLTHSLTLHTHSLDCYIV